MAKRINEKTPTAAAEGLNPPIAKVAKKSIKKDQGVVFIGFDYTKSPIINKELIDFLLFVWADKGSI